jgi:hypothetical protein
MKKLIVILLFLAYQTQVNAQESKLKFQFNFETVFRMHTQEYAINSVLENNDIAISKNGFVPAYLDLEYFFLNNTSIALGMGISLNQGKNYKMIGMPASLRIRQYVQDLHLSFGFRLDYESSGLSLYNNQTAIDLNNNNIQSSFVQLNNRFWHLGAIVSYDFAPNIRINVGYAVQIGAAKWQAEYANFSNEINEKNNHYAYVSVGYRFKTRE